VVSREPAESFRPRLLADAGIAFASTAAAPIDDRELQARLSGADLVFEATGAAAVVLPALRLLAPNGVAVLTSLTGGELAQTVDVASWNREMVIGNRLVVGTINAGRRHFEAAVRDLAEAEARLPGWMGRLIGRRLPCTEAVRALERQRDVIKTVLEFD
jgi:threonine dehydrogenase-like Zn-dependent dehydrogenase